MLQCIFVCMHMNSLQSTKQPGGDWYTCIHFTLLAYAPEQIWLPNCTYLSNSITTVVNMQTLCVRNETNYNFHLPWFCNICTNNKNFPQMPHKKFSSCADTRQWYQYFYLIWMHCNQKFDQKYWYTHISHYWHMSLNKYACHNCNLIYHAIAIYVSVTNMPSMPYAQITQCHSIREVC